MRPRVGLLLLMIVSLATAWESVGPFPAEVRPVTGAVSSGDPPCLALVCLTDSQPALRVSGDGGQSWTVRNPRLAFRPTALAFDPVSESTLVAVGGAAYVSTDLGSSWRNLPVPHAASWRGLEFPPGLPGRLNIVGTERTAAGSRAILACSSATGWRTVACDTCTPSYASTVQTDGTDTALVVVGGYSQGPCVFISEDGGAHWRRSNLWSDARQEWPQEEPPGGGVHAVLVFGAPHDAMLAMTRWQGMFRTTDAGASWRAIGDSGHLALAGMWGAPGHAAVSVGQGVRRTINAGAIWGRDWVLPGTSGVHFLAAVPGSPDVAYCASGPRVYRSSDGGWTWSLRGIQEGGVVTALSRGVEPAGPLYALASGERLFRAPPEGDSWEERALPPDGPFADVAAGSGDQVWLLGSGETGPARVLRSDDGGMNWVCSDSWLATGGGLAEPVGAVVLAVGSRLDSGDVEQLASSVSTDGGATWLHALHGPGRGGAAAVAGDNPGTMLAAGGGGDSARVLVSQDTGQTWARRDSGIPDPVKTALWTWNGTTAWCGTDQGVFASTDAGVNWGYRGLALVRDLAYCDSRYPRYFAATRTGCYTTVDGRNWYDVNYGLPTLDLSTLAPGQPSGVGPVFCGTNGAGVFREYLVGVGDDPAGRPLPATPGAMFARGRFRFFGEQAAVLRDVAGRVAARFRPGAYECVELAPGLYFLCTAGSPTPQRVVVVR